MSKIDPEYDPVTRRTRTDMAKRVKAYPHIDISVCPEQEDNDGNVLDVDAYVEAVRAAVTQEWPRATVSVQAGHTQDSEWYYVNGRASTELREFVGEHVDWTDEDLWVQA